MAAITSFSGDEQANETLYWLATSIPVGHGTNEGEERARRREKERREERGKFSDVVGSGVLGLCA